MDRCYVYILECADGSYYTGLTDAPAQRLAEHQAGEGYRSTAERRPVRWVWLESLADREDAAMMETRLKGWSRAKKQALIDGDVEALPLLAKKTDWEGWQQRRKGRS